MNNSKLSVTDLTLLRDIVDSESGICIKSEDVNAVERRLYQMIYAEGFGSMKVLMQGLRNNNRMFVRRTIESITVNETSFFRDASGLNLLCTNIVPMLLSRDYRSAIKLWCAGCSSGQEAYSIAIAVLESGCIDPRNLSILATDVSPSVVEKAQSGHYTDFELRRGLPNGFREKYFEKTVTGATVRPDVRQMIDFSVSNLNNLNHPNRDLFDVVFLRNVMLYFDDITRFELASSIKTRMSSDGYLFVGSSERSLETGHGLSRTNHVECQVYQVA